MEQSQFIHKNNRQTRHEFCILWLKQLITPDALQYLRKLLRIARQFVLQWVNIAGQLSGNIKRQSLDSQQRRILWQSLTI